jgi:hypothetical protein
VSLIVLAIALILQASFLAVGTPLPENLTHFHTRIRVSQMLLIDALRTRSRSGSARLSTPRRCGVP